MPPYSLKRLEALANRLAQGGLPIQNRQELAAELTSFSQFSFSGKLDKIVVSNSSFQDIEEFANALGSSSQEGEIRIVFKIFEFLKKKKEFFNRPLLSLEEYLFLGEKRAPNFLYDRRELYTLALYYEKKLEEHGLYDEIDLAKRALLERKQSALPSSTMEPEERKFMERRVSSGTTAPDSKKRDLTASHRKPLGLIVCRSSPAKKTLSRLKQRSKRNSR